MLLEHVAEIPPVLVAELLRDVLDGNVCDEKLLRLLDPLLSHELHDRHARFFLEQVREITPAQIHDPCATIHGQFFSEMFHTGVVGYYYIQLTGDNGDGATLGDFKARVAGLGPQAGWFLENKWYVNLKGYWEFAAQNRPEGWNVWLTLAIPLSRAKP